MPSYFYLIAAVEPPQLPAGAPIRGSRMVFGDALLIIAVGVAFALIFFVWAKYFRKSETETTTHHWLQEDDDEEESDTGKHKGHRRKKKRLRRDHRPRNPTLAETGGLPPPRPPEQTS